MAARASRPGHGPPGRRATGLPEAPGSPSPRVTEAETKSATFGYLGAIFTGPVIPLVCTLLGRRRSPFRRFHAATALNLSLTGLLYAVCCLILCGMLLLDSITVALVVAIPIAAGHLAVGAEVPDPGLGAANRGERYDIPAWICAQHR